MEHGPTIAISRSSACERMRVSSSRQVATRREPASESESSSRMMAGGTSGRYPVTRRSRVFTDSEYRRLPIGPERSPERTHDLSHRRPRLHRGDRRRHEVRDRVARDVCELPQHTVDAPGVTGGLDPAELRDLPPLGLGMDLVQRDGRLPLAFVRVLVHADDDVLSRLLLAPDPVRRVRDLALGEIPL